ncbi:MAG: insulinase family protein [Alphaproteobacteria bacterium]|nr:insulinase family protein [Alphaproteobacteria bacterium]
MTTISAIALTIVALPAMGADAERPPEPATVRFPYDISTTELDNGLRVVAVPMPTPGVVAWEVRMSVGSGSETEKGRTGFAHFFEHLMFHGTETLPRERRLGELLRLGVDDGGWTWLDETTYPALLPASSLPRWIDIEADLFQHLALTPEGVRREAGAVYGEFRKSSANPENVLEDRLMEKMFGTHPYGHSTLGFEEDIAAMPDSWEAARAFFDAWYRPEHATLVVAGDVQPEALFAAVTEAFGPWERAEHPPVDPGPPAERPPARVTLTWETPTEPVLLMDWRVPAYGEEGHEALDWAADLLTAPGGPLDTRLVRDGLARSAYATVYPTVQAGILAIRVAAADAEDLPRIEEIVREEVARLAENADAATMDTMRVRQRYALLSGLDDPARVADFVGHRVRRDRDPAAIDARLTAHANITPGEVEEAAARWLKPDDAFVGIVVGGGQ